ncbi:MAG: Mov34/MPN/PAD-1 family protein [Methanomassiliicoccales archaeon]|nr:MAG: Mov34/MPN/PAD-1 family protein [Methanomassiliicoccales archaeon]
MKFFKRDKQKTSPKTQKDAIPKRRVWGINTETLQLILEVSKETYPNEFVATLIAKKGVIEEINLLPGTLSGNTTATIRTHMQPPDITLSVVGIVHSHPSGDFRPSGADLFFFSKFGNTHIIVGTPYDINSWQAYDSSGQPIEIKIVD